MNTLADVNTLAIVFSLLSLSGAIAAATGWSQHRPEALAAVRFMIVALLLLSLAIAGFVSVMYFYLSSQPAYPFGYAPTSDQTKLAVFLVCLHAINMQWLATAYRHYERQRGYYGV